MTVDWWQRAPTMNGVGGSNQLGINRISSVDKRGLAPQGTIGISTHEGIFGTLGAASSVQTGQHVPSLPTFRADKTANDHRMIRFLPQNRIGRLPLVDTTSGGCGQGSTEIVSNSMRQPQTHA